VPRPIFRFKHYELGGLRAGTTLEVTLSAVNNVRLMTDPHFKRFLETQPYRYIGGVTKKSPVRLTIPEDGLWHLVVDTEGHHGLAESSVKLLADAKPVKISG
jgi:hypothetical protein